MNYHTSYILDKDYYHESFEQSLPFSHRRQLKYPLVLLLVGLTLFSMFKLQNNYLGYFLFALAILEVVAYKYQQPWWVARQRLTRAAGNEVTLRVDEQGISTEINAHKKQYSWPQIKEVLSTQKGIIIVTDKGARHYFPARVLNEEVIAFIFDKNKAT
ncbi:YcxB family protein [Pseudoalteromonas sp. CNC9-20]|uniref:YcxB family protein n=1 Tax=Pseudoalteromonas sp. CNC9-20 TaxID=2917750 RepID=UPI001EF45590|nr:YcxB family protein [Pseudoalteromonas sp. CNC9-20]MCG7570863.1 YcxB family protein [Pseudoalteromonas sp. CNC9-20]